MLPGMSHWRSRVMLSRCSRAGAEPLLNGGVRTRRSSDCIKGPTLSSRRGKGCHGKTRINTRKKRAERIVIRSRPKVVNTAGVSVASPAPNALPPPAVFQAACNMSITKAGYSWDKTLVLGFLAGSLIGIGAVLCSVVSGSSPALASNNPGLASFVKGAIGFPAGLAMVVLTGAELFPGNVFFMLSGALTKKVEIKDLAKNWFWSFNGNFLGSIFVALLAFMAKTTASEMLTASVTKAAVAKVSMDFGTLFAKGILCNWLVCVAVWMALASNTITGKLMGIFIPISTFVALGFENSVANMCLISQGMLAGSAITIKQFLLGNMLPVTLGNIVGGGLFVAFAHYYVYGR